MAVKDKPGKSKEQVQKSLKLSDVVEALRRYRKSKNVSALPTIQRLYDVLCRHRGQWGAKTTDTINWLGLAAQGGTGYYPALLNELSSDEVLGDIETEFQQTTSGGKAPKLKVKPPSKEAIQAYQLQGAANYTQSQIADKMNKKLHRKDFTQYKVSRMLKSVKKWYEANGLPFESKPTITPTDPKALTMGFRTDGKKTGDPRIKPI